MSASAVEFQPAGLKDSMQLLGPPPGLDAIATPSERSSCVEDPKKTSYPPGLAPISDPANACAAPPGLSCPPGLDVPGVIAGDAGIQNFDLDIEDSERLTQEKLRLSNQVLEMESKRLIQQNEILRTKLSSTGQGPPGVWQPSAWTSTDPWSAWPHRAYEPWTQVQGYEYQTMIGQLGLAVTKDEDECSEVSDLSTVDLSGSEDTEDSTDSPTTSPEVHVLDA